jgi:hypothetical protein
MRYLRELRGQYVAGRSAANVNAHDFHPNYTDREDRSIVSLSCKVQKPLCIDPIGS